MAIKNIEHDQDASQVDHESGDSLKIASQSGTPVKDDTGIYEAVSKKTLADRFKVNVVYASKDADTTLPTSKFAYDASSKNDSEATEGVSNKTKQSDDKQNEDQDNDQQSDSSKKNKGKSDGNNQGKSKNNKKSGANKNNNQNPGSDDESEPTVYDTTGDNPDIPEVGSIAATRQTAVIVQMLSGDDGDGTTALRAADTELMGGEFSEVFSDEGVSSVAKAWKKDGAKSSQLEIDKLVEAKPDTVLVTSTNYFTTKQKTALSKAGISVTVVPGLTSATRIKATVQTIGKMLDKETDGVSTDRAEQYVTYHDGLASKIEGSRGYGASSKDREHFFDADAESASTMFTSSMYTLVIDKWDEKATYNYEGVISASDGGVGLSTVGYKTSPVSYYLGVAGVVNMAAAIETTGYFDGQLAPAWQFNANVLSPSGVKLSGSVDGELLPSAFYSGTGWTKTTLTSALNKNNVTKYGFGTEYFPIVIVADEDMRSNFIRSAASSKGLYHAFGLSADGRFQGVQAGSQDILTTIDPDVDVDKQVVVNPQGLFSSWLEGSVESCLESAWAASRSEFNGEWTSDELKEEVKDFYKTFYRYPGLSDKQLKSILNPEES